MNEGISQEEIDRLLDQAGGDSENNKEDKSTEFNYDNEKLTTLFTNCYESVASALSVVISKDLIFKDLEIKDVELSEFKKEELDNYIIAEVLFGGDEEGLNLLLLEKPFCSLVSDLFLGGEGNKEKEINEETLDTFKEIVNQIFGTLGTAFSSGVGTNIALDLNSIALHPDGYKKKETEEPSKMVQISYNIEIPDLYSGKYIHIISKNMVEKFFNILNETKDTQPPQTKEIQDDTESEPEKVPTTVKSKKVDHSNIDLILDIELPVNVLLGETELTIHDVLQLCPGSIIELNRSVEEPVDVIVNNKLVAKGEVVVLDSYFALKITEIQSHIERIKSLGEE